MKKQRKQLIMLLVVLLLLIAGYFGVQKYNEVQSEKEEASIERVVDVTIDEVTELSYEYEGEELTFVKEEDIWKYKEDTSLSIVQSSIASMISQIAQMESQGKMENVTNLSEYGLEEPIKEISFVADGISYQIAIGDYNSVADVDYVTVNDSRIVYAVETTFQAAFGYALEDLIEAETEEDTTNAVE